jgi:hypothetical protein
MKCLHKNPHLKWVKVWWTRIARIEINLYCKIF